MRNYPSNSPQAAGRLLALTMVVDGNVLPSELDALDHSRILAHIALDRDSFRQLLQDLCEDLLAGAHHGVIQLDPAVLDSLLLDIADPALRRRLLQAMWHIADADGYLADGEAVLLARASMLWGAETGFANGAPLASPAPAAL
ncbi:TerB family tellurite resistance protein [Massilia sp. DWR3-1-1]|uniref:tellurite resistance TerB family protein n=1 Tax=Massilia sp. DWR3-1-1 TaxID=2804559 RepID=UPI003CF11DE3